MAESSAATTEPKMGGGRVRDAVRNFERDNAEIRALSEEDEHGSFTGTCQSCGFYWDVRQQPVCPCGGEVL